MRRIKKWVVLGLAVTFAASSTFCVSAAGLRDVFNAKFYADSYKDVAEVFGDDEEALYQHFLTYGLKEGRKASVIFDVAKYREAYGDLDEAFGDNWDAYVEHYFTFGAAEKRNVGVLFDPVAYAEAYPDVAEAYGDDVEAIINHYLTCGISEGRTAGVVVEEEKPAKTSSSSGGSSSTTPQVDSQSIKAYTNLKATNDGKAALGTPTSLTATTSRGGGSTEETAFSVDIQGVQRSYYKDGFYWYAVAVPSAGEGSHYWLKTGDDSWADVSTNVKQGTNEEEDDLEGMLIYALGSDNCAEGTVVICVSTQETSENLSGNGTYYKLNVSFAEYEEILVYKNVTATAGGITALGGADSIKPKSGNGGVSTDPYVVSVEGVSQDQPGSGSAWFAVALPNGTLPESMNQWWIKIGETWSNVTSTKMNVSDKPDGDYMVYGIGVGGITSGDKSCVVELCISKDTSSLSSGVYYKIDVTFADATEAESAAQTSSYTLRSGAGDDAADDEADAPEAEEKEADDRDADTDADANADTDADANADADADANADADTDADNNEMGEDA